MKCVLFLVILTQIVYFAVSEPTHQAHHTQHAGAKASQVDSKGSSYEQHGQEKKSGGSSTHDVEKGKKGQATKELQKSEDEEGGGKKHTHHSEGHHSSAKKSSGGSAHGLKFHDGAKRKKANYKKGFREKYHKDEEKKHDRFYSNGHKSGEYTVFGSKHAKHSSNQSSKKHGGNFKKSSSSDAHGKSGAKAGGHNKQDESGHKGSQESQSHHQHNNKWAKKGGSKGGKQYHFSAPKQ